MNTDVERLRSIKSFPSLVKYLRDELDWPIESDDVEELSFDYQPEELGLDSKTAVKIKEIKQLRPFVTNQPWGIFYINFEPKQLPIVALRRILSKLVFKKRQSGNKAQQATWQLNDLLFISSYGESDERAISFAHFSEDKVFGDLPTLRVLGWDSQDTVLHLEHAHETLREKLRWPENESNYDDWRKTWSSAFTLRPRQVIRTSRELALKLADLAIDIRKRANSVLAIESEKGPLRTLYKAFQEALIHDLSEDDFADMYAQTISYGLLSAYFMRPSGIVADNLVDIIHYNTNPFLKETLSQFLTVGGRRKQLDFDELGINEVIELLRNSDLEAVKRDFGDRRPNEDPAIHFYELFLKEYDPQKRVKRGVFYTPIPVVKFIVRSVDEILRNEFGLEDGLADTTTWGEMAKRNADLAIPAGVSAEEPFVQILDPATGTGTFLVEVIETIHATMMAKWGEQRKSKDEIYELWNDYVPRHLLPRVYGFELMMAPYAIAHMKIGLKLRETHYSFISSERARIYLTNTLEEPKEFSSYFEQMAPALAHEATAANRIKNSVPITVIIGNPPYSSVSANLGESQRAMVDAYRYVDGQKIKERGALQLEKNLQDDYVKFIRYAQMRSDAVPKAVAALITNHSYIDNPTLRGLRRSLMLTYSSIWLVDLHGNSKRKEISPFPEADKNVFDIQQGVAISAAVKNFIGSDCELHWGELWGSRETKYQALLGGAFAGLTTNRINALPVNYLFVPQDEERRREFAKGIRLDGLFSTFSTGIATARDSLAIQFSRAELEETVNTFSSLPTEEARKHFDLGKDTNDWKVGLAQEDITRNTVKQGNVFPILYRPFDRRFTFYTGQPRGFICNPRWPVMQHMLGGRNIALCVAKSVEAGKVFSHVFVSNSLADHHSVSLKEVNYILPLWKHSASEIIRRGQKLLTPETSGAQDRISNLPPEIVSLMAGRLAIADQLKNGAEVRPQDLFHYVYAILHSPSYRARYAEFLKKDFAHIPATSNSTLFRELSGQGADLVALHLLEDDYEAASWNIEKDEGGGMKDKSKNPLSTLITQFEGSGNAEVAKGHPKYSDGKVFINPTRYFEGVPEQVWNFHIGGYQVCEKWLKDRRGRTLSDEEINHYERVVVALNETIRLMAEIDRVIEEHGGWPLVGSQDVAGSAGVPARNERDSANASADEASAIPGALPFA